MVKYLPFNENEFIKEEIIEGCKCLDLLNIFDRFSFLDKCFFLLKERTFVKIIQEFEP
jgi:hypothetical protein